MGAGSALSSGLIYPHQFLPERLTFFFPALYLIQLMQLFAEIKT